MLHYISCLVVPYCIKKIIFTLIALRALYHSICDRCISPLLKQRCLANCHAISGRAIFRTNVTKKYCMSGEKPSGPVRHKQAGPSDSAPVQGLLLIIIVTQIIVILQHYY